jgi:hypothetical protein
MMKTRARPNSPSQGTNHETAPKKIKIKPVEVVGVAQVTPQITEPWTNMSTVAYLKTFYSHKRSPNIKADEHMIPTLATRYSKRHQQVLIATLDCHQKNVPVDESRVSSRIACETEKGLDPEQYKIHDTSMGFSWWDHPEKTASLTQKQYNQSSHLIRKGFNGDILLKSLAGPHLAYAFVVPWTTQIGLMTAFKTMPNQLLVRERMKELSSMKTCYYTQLHWKKGNGNTSHLNESDWRDNPLLDPTVSLLLDSYMTTLSTAISSTTGWNMNYKTLCSILETEKAGHQAPHIDDKGCFNKEERYRPFILHHPLCEEGSSIQIWLPNSTGTRSPTILHVPFGTALLLRGDVYHAGSYGSKGNLRFHAHLTPTQCTAEGRELGILNVDNNERLRETDLPAETVNDIMLRKNKEQVNFTNKYIKRMKQVIPVATFWGQHPEKNALGKPKRKEYS